MCDRLPGCSGFSVDATTGDSLCYPTNTTSRSAAAFTPMLSYVQQSVASAVTSPHSDGDACAAALRSLCPSNLSTQRCRVCTGESQHQELLAGCTTDDVAHYCATSVDWWVAIPTDHVFEDDLPTMSQYCSQPDSSSPGQAEQTIQWAAIAGGTVASQLALRWPSPQNEGAATVVFDVSDLTAVGRAKVPAASMSVRQLGSVFAPTGMYPSERGEFWYLLRGVHICVP